MKPNTCAICGAPDATPMFGRVTPLCSPCDREWYASKEREAMALAAIERAKG
jgi:hypothetical protein